MMIVRLVGKWCGLGVFAVLSWMSVASAASLVEKPEAAFRQAFPQVKVDSMEETDIKGLYEVISGQNILYYFPEKDYIFLG